MGAPRSSVTVTNTFTSFTSTLILVSGACAQQAQGTANSTQMTIERIAKLFT